MKTESKKRGGKRPNSGRKNMNSKLVQIYIPLCIYEEFKKSVKELKENLMKKLTNN